jgi:hypothetical protein
MLFLGMANAYIMRTNMSVAIVAMVNHTALEVSKELVDDECPDTDYGNHTVSHAFVIKWFYLHFLEFDLKIF